MTPFPRVRARGNGPVKYMKKFNAETASTIINFLKAGAFIETAAAAAGITKQTLYDWLKRGKRQGKGAMFEFVQETEQAMAMSEVNAIGQISRAAVGVMVDGRYVVAPQWQAAAWHLERKYPDRWGRRDRIEHTGSMGIASSFRGAAREKLESAIAEVEGESATTDEG